MNQKINYKTLIIILLYFWLHNRVILKARKRRHQYLEFRHKQGEIKKKTLQKSTLEKKTG